MSNVSSISKILNGKIEQDRDGTDTICNVKTKFNKSYSFTNGHGKYFDKQKDLLLLLMTQLSIYTERAKEQLKHKAYR